MSMNVTRIIVGLACAWPWASSSRAAEIHDLVIHGGTSAGVVSALQATGVRKTAIIVHPGRHLSGLTSGGVVPENLYLLTHNDS